MQTVVDELLVRIAADTSKLQSSLRKANDLTEKSTVMMATSFDRVQKSISSVGKSLLATFVAFQGIRIGKSFLDAAVTAENFKIRLNVMLGSVEQGNKLFQDMSKYASGVAFEYEHVLGAATQLATVLDGGVAQIEKYMPLVADIAAATGLTLQQSSEQFARAFSAGIGAADLFRERGVNAVLGFKAGAQVSVEETRAAFDNALQDMNFKFRGASKGLANTWTGLTSMLKDKWFQFRNNVMNAGLFDYLKKQVNSLNEFLQNKDIQSGLVEIAKGLATIGIMAARAATGIGMLVSSIKSVPSLLSDLNKEIPKNKKAMQDYIDSFSSAGVPNTKEIKDFMNSYKQVSRDMQQGVISSSGTQTQDPISGPIEEGVKKTEPAFKKLKDQAIVTFESIDRQVKVSAESWSDQLASNLAKGKASFADFRDFITGVMQDIATAIIKSHITDPLINMAVGGIGGLFGGKVAVTSPTTGTGISTPSLGNYSNSFSPLQGFASGGPVSAGIPIQVGERGRELFVPQTDGYIVPNHDLRSSSSSSSPSISVIQNINISPGVEQTVDMKMREYLPAFKEQAKAGVFEAIERGGVGAKAVGRRR